MLRERNTLKGYLENLTKKKKKMDVHLKIKEVRTLISDNVEFKSRALNKTKNKLPDVESQSATKT